MNEKFCSFTVFLFITVPLWGNGRVISILYFVEIGATCSLARWTEVS